MHQGQRIEFKIVITNQQADLLHRVLSPEQADALAALSRYVDPPFSYEETTNAVTRIGKEEGCDAILSIGDTKTSLIAALAAKKARTPLIHYESGLRCRGLRRIEEVIRRKIDKLAQFHLCYNQVARENLLREGVANEDIVVVGSLYSEIASDLLSKRGFETGAVRYVLVTVHRKENAGILQRLAKSLESIHDVTGLNVMFVRHPSNDITELSIAAAANPWLTISEELRQERFLDVLHHASLVITDSAGISEQATIMGRPTAILRSEIERPWLVGERTILADPGTLCDKIVDLVRLGPGPVKETDSFCSRKIVRSIEHFLERRGASGERKIAI